VNIVIHSAATVRFDEHLRTAVNININALQDILKLSKGIKNLKVRSLVNEVVRSFFFFFLK
jgi:fatty acyl-CoA reductase